MAKSKKNKITDTGLERPKKNKGNKIIILVIILFLIGAMFVFRKPILELARKIPLIDRMISVNEKANDEQDIEEVMSINENYKKELEDLTKELELLKSNYKDITSKNETLQKYEDQYLDFMNQKEEWDVEIANQNPELYISYYEEIYPETATEIYKVLRGNILLTDEQQATIKAVQNMEPEQAAKALEVLLSTDIELVKIIMGNMKGDEKSTILDNMKSESAAAVIKLILPREGGKQ